MNGATRRSVLGRETATKVGVLGTVPDGIRDADAFRMRKKPHSRDAHTDVLAIAGQRLEESRILRADLRSKTDRLRAVREHNLLIREALGLNRRHSGTNG